MPLVHFDRVHETTATTGTGALTLAGAVDASFRTFASVCSTSDTFYYTLVEAGVAWETGLGTYSGTNTLTRTSVKASSNGGSAINLGSGAKFVFMTPIAFMFPTGVASFAAGGAITNSGITISTARLAGRTTGSTGALEEISIGAGLTLSAGSLSVTANTYQPLDADLTTIAANITAAGHAILDDADAGAQRTTLGAAASGAITGSGLTMSTARMLARTTASTGAVEELTAAQGRTFLGVVGKQAIFIPASAMVSRTTNGAAAGTAEMSTNKNMFATLDFDTTTQEFAQFAWCMPSSWDEGTVTFIPVWSHPSTTTNFGVVFQLAGVAISNDDAGDVAFGTAQTSTDTGGTTNDIYKGPESSAITIAGSPAAGDYVMFQVARVPANGSDTMAVDARLHGIVLFITTNDTVDS